MRNRHSLLCRLEHLVIFINNAVQGLAEKDNEARAFTEKLLTDQKFMETRMKDLEKDYNDCKVCNRNGHYTLYIAISMQDTIGRLTKRKEELKDMIVELQEKLEESENTQE